MNLNVIVYFCGTVQKRNIIIKSYLYFAIYNHRNYVEGGRKTYFP